MTGVQTGALPISEAHIHNHIQKTLFDKLDYEDTQIIYSTHSTQISEVSNVERINILAKKQNFAEVYQPSTGLESENINEIQRYLDAVRTNLLFAKGVMLVEGDAEEILVPMMIKKVLGVSLDELGISLINIRSTGFENVAQLFCDNRIRRKCSILTDLDDAICDTTILKTDTEKIIKYKTKVKNSKAKGLERKDRLDKFEKGNNWVKVFYADYTFEVDFVKDGNGWEVVQIIDKIYTDKSTKQRSKSDLESDDVSKYGKRVLTMATQEGKGWFAIMLGEHISYKTVIPRYILDAIIFAKESYTNDLIADIIEYRLDRIQEDEKTLNLTTCYSLIKEYRNDRSSIENIISEIKSVIGDDQVLTLLYILK